MNLIALIGWDRKYDFTPAGNLPGFNIAIPELLLLEPDNRIEIRRLRLQSEALSEIITTKIAKISPISGLGPNMTGRMDISLILTKSRAPGASACL